MELFDIDESLIFSQKEIDCLLCAISNESGLDRKNQRIREILKKRRRNLRALIGEQRDVREALREEVKKLENHIKVLKWNLETKQMVEDGLKMDKDNQSEAIKEYKKGSHKIIKVYRS